MPNLHKIDIHIADIHIQLTSPLSAADLGIERRFRPFMGTGVTTESPANVALRWQESHHAIMPNGELIYDPKSVWKMYFDGACYNALMTYHSVNQPAQSWGVLRANPAWNNLTLLERRNGPTWRSLLNTGAGDLILRTAIIFTNGLIFHASGINDNGRGLVFAGHSGIGKSTQLNLWRDEMGVTALDDDRVAVRVTANNATCYGTPWKDIVNNDTVPLSAIIVLEQAVENEIQRLTPAAAASLLAARAFLPYWDAALMRHALANLNAILAIVPVYQLRCRPERAVIPLVRSVL
ncbi:MAG: hypothetical protein P1S60_19025 [Anaerolineae bacterium]|nr:hypothetical protein [Anaerolineae bacterium]